MCSNFSSICLQNVVIVEELSNFSNLYRQLNGSTLLRLINRKENRLSSAWIFETYDGPFNDWTSPVRLTETSSLFDVCAEVIPRL